MTAPPIRIERDYNEQEHLEEEADSFGNFVKLFGKGIAYLNGGIMAMFVVMTIFGGSGVVLLAINAFIPPLLMVVLGGFIMAAKDKYKAAGKDSPGSLTGTLFLVLFLWLLTIVSMTLWVKGITS